MCVRRKGRGEGVGRREWGEEGVNVRRKGRGDWSGWEKGVGGGGSGRWGEEEVGGGGGGGGGSRLPIREDKRKEGV